MERDSSARRHLVSPAPDTARRMDRSSRGRVSRGRSRTRSRSPHSVRSRRSSGGHLRNQDRELYQLRERLRVLEGAARQERGRLTRSRSRSQAVHHRSRSPGRSSETRNCSKDEPASSGESGDESGSEPESPSEKLMQMHKQEWANHEANEAMKRESHEAHASTSTTQEADSSKPSQPGLAKIMPKIEMPGGAVLYPGVLGLDGIGNNMGLGSLAMSYPHSFILGLANQGQDGASSSSQPQFITIPLSMANMAMAGASGNNGCSSDDSSELQDLSTGRK